MSGYAQTKMMHPTSGRVVHPNIICDNCGDSIGGVRYACLDCPNYDLCARCESLAAVTDAHFNGQHLFAKVRDSAAVDVKRYREALQ